MFYFWYCSLVGLLNWITHPIYLYRRKLAEMQTKHFDE